MYILAIAKDRAKLLAYVSVRAKLSHSDSLLSTSAIIYSLANYSSVFF